MSRTADRIAPSLPRAPAPFSPHYSGLLPISKSKRIHYYYIESESPTAATDPITFWTNGGPGCSGLLALFTEHGPWRPLADGTLVRNPASWTTRSAMVFVEQPAGVGYSYTSDPSEVKFNDFAAAEDFLDTMHAFFDRFPGVENRTLYIASESYGGHYMPQLALKLLACPRLGPRFTGMLVGNPYTSYSSGQLAGAATLWGLQVVDAPLWAEYLAYGCADLDLTAYAFSDACFALMDALYTEAQSLNPYALDFPTCPATSGYRHHAPQETTLATSFGVYSGSAQARQLVRLMDRLRSLRQGANFTAATSSSKGRSHSTWQQRQRARRPHLAGNTHFAPAAVTVTAAESSSTATLDDPFWLAPKVPEGLPYDPCTEGYALAYLNDPAVQHAMHVLPADRGQTVVDYAFCNDAVFEQWALMDSYADTTHLYPEILDATEARGTDFALLVFSGDSDGVCGTVGTQHWIYDAAAAAHRPQVRLWQPWLLDGGHGQQGGFLTRFRGNFSFATVHTAGHEVPAYQPKAALALFAAFLDRSIFAPSNRSVATRATSTGGSSKGGGYGEAQAVQIMVALCVVLVVAFAVLLVGYFAYAKRRLEHAQRQRFGGSGDGLQDFDDADVDTDGSGGGGGGGEAADDEHESGRRPMTVNPMSVGRGPAGSVSIQGLPDPAVTMRPAQEVLI